jgi:LysR family cys regulon transcriptional activator
MKLQQLKYLLAVAENGMNMTAAAERLHTSQPGVSKQLRLLEQELGLSLFVRKGRSLEGLTAEGEEVLARAARIMREVEVIRGISGELYDQNTGKLSIGTTHTQARYVLPDVIRRFRERYPDVTLDLHQGTSEQLAQMAEQRRIDFVIVSEPRRRFPDLYLLPCFRWDRVILVPKEHELATLDRQPTLEELAAHPLVTYVFSFDRESSLKRAFAARGLEPKVVFTARDADVIKTYVRIGLGIGVVASMAQDCGEEDDLVALDGAGLFPRCTTWLGFRRELVLRRYMYEFIELFAAHLDERVVREMVMLDDQEEIDAALADAELPLKRPCA